jgi:signal transduction histidine kinase/FixJ family two-component response regulator
MSIRFKLFTVIAVLTGVISFAALWNDDGTPSGRAHRWDFAVVVLCSLGSAAAAYNFKKISESLSGTAGHETIPTPDEKRDSGASSAKWDFIANMSGEMRTPLNAIIGLSEMSLESGRIQKEDYEIIEKIYNSGVILSNFVNDISEITKNEFEKFDLVSTEYDTADLINDAISPNMMRLENKPVKFNLHIDETFPLKLRGDELKVKYIFNNILSNAFKYTYKGSVDWYLNLDHDPNDENAVWVVSKVRDTGIGISSEDIPRILPGYGRTDSRVTRSADGAGLGLSITKRMVEMMGGSISVESGSGKGSVFTTRILQAAACEETIGRETARDLRNLHYVDTRRRNASKLVRESIPYASVLVVDDAEPNLEIAREILKPYGMRVDCVDSGQAAIELIMEEDVKYDAILLDHMMPGMDGTETARLIRKIGTEYAGSIPIIALSSNKTSATEEMFLKKGFQAFLAKPVDIMLLNNVINRWVRDDSGNRQAREETARPDHSPEVRRIAVPDAR